MGNARMKMLHGPFQVEISPDPYSLVIRRNGQVVLSNSPRDELRAEGFKRSMDRSAALEFPPPKGRELGLSLEGDMLGVKWSSPEECDFGDSYQIPSGGYWYGGGFLKPQYFPLNDGTMDVALFPQGNVQLPYWYTSSGMGILVHDYRPVHWSFNAKKDGQFRIGRFAGSFEYCILLGEGPRDVYRKAIALMGRPKAAPADVEFALPIYSTWAQYKTAIDQEKTLRYARDIVAKGFPVGTMEIDDKWEVHYGDFTFDGVKFTNPRGMVEELHGMGFVVTLWVYPFINLDSENYQRLGEMGFLVKGQNGQTLTVTWWNGDAAEIDFTNPLAADWFRRKLRKLQEDYGFDGFKFDAGDASFFPEGSIAHQPIYSAEYGDRYMQFIADNFPRISETRVSTFAQALGLLTRHGDKDSTWGLDNGLHSVLTTTLSLSTVGYPFVLPDMIGGNEYGDQKCDSEMLIRWMELSAPMPSIQFSIIPWREGYDDYTVFLNKEYAWLHCDLAPYILQLVRVNLREGWPINRPLFFDHDGHNLYEVNDEFMLGDGLLFAPIVKEGATKRDITLPHGHWLDLWDGKEYAGGIIRGLPAPLYKLPAFLDMDKGLDPSITSKVRSRLHRIEVGSKAPR
jgi:alpha-glucosidase (family GH31 glycosyl hydrolase)